jgi:hypothetical protein
VSGASSGRRHSLFLRLLLTVSLIIVATTLVTGSITYLFFSAHLRSTAYAHNIEMLTQTRYIVEVVLKGIVNSGYSLALSQEVQLAASATRWDIPAMLPILRELNDDFVERVSSSPSIHSIYLLSRPASKILTDSGVTALAEFHDRQVFDAVGNPGMNPVWLTTRSIDRFFEPAVAVLTMGIGVPVASAQSKGVLIINVTEEVTRSTTSKRSGPRRTLPPTDGLIHWPGVTSPGRWPPTTCPRPSLSVTGPWTRWSLPRGTRCPT